MARPRKSRITIVQGDYTLQKFEIGNDLLDTPYDLTPFDRIEFTLKTATATYDIDAIDNDPDSDLLNGVVAFRMQSADTKKFPIGRWNFAVHLYFGTEVSTPVFGTAIVVDGLNIL